MVEKHSSIFEADNFIHQRRNRCFNTDAVEAADVGTYVHDLKSFLRYSKREETKNHFVTWRRMSLWICLSIVALLIATYSIFDEFNGNRLQRHNLALHSTTLGSISIQESGVVSTSTQSEMKDLTQIELDSLSHHLSNQSSQTTRGFNDTARMNFVKKMMKHAWTGYMKYAAGFDELNTLTKSGRNWYSKHSMLSTPVDALDTLWIMGLEKEYMEAKNLVLSKLDLNIPEYINVFETNIRILGGLEAAYELEGDTRFLDLAVQLGDKLMGAFSHDSPFPTNSLQLSSGMSYSQSVCSLAQTGTLQLEFQYLSDVSGDAKYQTTALRVIDAIASLDSVIPGIYPTTFGRNGAVFAHALEYGIAAEADSFYEYLIKLWISTKDEKYRALYDAAARSISNYLVVTSEAFGMENMTYIPDLKINPRGAKFGESFHHLSCFVGGMFALGSVTKSTKDSASHLDLAAKITETCYHAYGNNHTGIQFGFEEYDPSKQPTAQTSRKYVLRPEVIESIFYMWRITHNPIYREYGWALAQNIEEKCKTQAGYSGLPKSDHPIQESFFLAETLKYLYLLFTDDDVIPLEKYVFNTEAHPISIRGHGRRSEPSKWIPIQSYN